MGKLYIMMGQPGCGKSTFIEKNKNKLSGSTVVVSRDTIRFSMVKENEEYFSKENEVFKEFIHQIKEGLATADNVIVDATHLNHASRNKLLSNIGRKNYDTAIVIWIKTSLDTTLKQNQMRKGTRSFVPESAIKRMFYQMQPPEFEEGFSAIYIVEGNHIVVRKKM